LNERQQRAITSIGKSAELIAAQSFRTLEASYSNESDRLTARIIWRQE
jgi:hypothetical protein